jgi:hypothetical protein
MSQGYVGIPLDATALIRARFPSTFNAHFNQAKQALAAGRSVILYSALGAINPASRGAKRMSWRSKWEISCANSSLNPVCDAW